MTQPASPDRPTDEMLTAYLDGELAPGERQAIDAWVARDEAVRVRLAVLASGARPFRQAYAPLLAEAPRDRLAAMLTDAPARRHATVGRFPPAWALAAAIVLLVLGAAADRFVPAAIDAFAPGGTEEAPDEWRQAVAQYLTLYTTETLAGIPDDAEARGRELDTVGAKFHLPLSPANVALDGLALKRAQIFQYDGHPLAQIVYLDPAAGPVALCAFADGEADAPARTERRLGLNVVYWSANGRAFMLIGRLAPDRLQPLAASVTRRLPL